MDNRDSLIFYRSFYEAIRELPIPNQSEVYNAIFEYGLNFNEVELTGLSKTIFTLIKPQIEANVKRYHNGKKAKVKPIANEVEAKPKQEISKTEAKQKQTESKREANKNVNVNVNVNKNVNGNDNVAKTAIPPLPEFLFYAKEKCLAYEYDYETLKPTIMAKYDSWVENGWCVQKDKKMVPILKWKSTLGNTLPFLNLNHGKQHNSPTKKKFVAPDYSHLVEKIG